MKQMTLQDVGCWWSKQVVMTLIPLWTKDVSYSKYPNYHIIFFFIFYQEGRIEEAFEKYTEAQKIIGYSSELTYYIALCHYLQRRYVPSLKSLSEIIERAVRDHPGKSAAIFSRDHALELNIGMGPDHSDETNHDLQVLHESFVLEAFNLKAAIEYQLKNCTSQNLSFQFIL